VTRNTLETIITALQLKVSVTNTSRKHTNERKPWKPLRRRQFLYRNLPGMEVNGFHGRQA
jgi:hypothetical protein